MRIHTFSICIRAFRRHADLVGISAENIQHLCERNRSKIWGADGWKKGAPGRTRLLFKRADEMQTCSGGLRGLGRSSQDQCSNSVRPCGNGRLSRRRRQERGCGQTGHGAYLRVYDAESVWHTCQSCCFFSRSLADHRGRQMQSRSIRTSSSSLQNGASYPCRVSLCAPLKPRVSVSDVRYRENSQSFSA